MALLNRTFHGDFDEILSFIHSEICEGSISATLEESCEWVTDTGRCAVRIYERYSYIGGNRLSMNVTLFQSGDEVKLCAATAGGSQAVFFKINTWGEEAFLDTLRSALNRRYPSE